MTCRGDLVFFFQAEDGIRDDLVTGVQTCALPICGRQPDHAPPAARHRSGGARGSALCARHRLDRKSTRLNSSHQIISYAVFCLKKKKKESVDQVRSPSYMAHFFLLKTYCYTFCNL